MPSRSMGQNPRASLIFLGSVNRGSYECQADKLMNKASAADEGRIDQLATIGSLGKLTKSSAASAAHTDHAQANSSGLAWSTFAGRVTPLDTLPRPGTETEGRPKLCLTHIAVGTTIGGRLRDWRGPFVPGVHSLKESRAH